jgi:hypothetical protein
MKRSVGGDDFIAIPGCRERSRATGSRPGKGVGFGSSHLWTSTSTCLFLNGWVGLQNSA